MKLHTRCCIGVFCFVIFPIVSNVLAGIDTNGTCPIILPTVTKEDEWLPLSPQYLTLSNRSSVTLDVKSCGDVHVTMEILGRGRLLHHIEIIIRINNNESEIQSETNSSKVLLYSIDNESSCNKKEKFLISWKRHIEVQKEVNSTMTIFLVYNMSSYDPGHPMIHNIFLGYDSDFENSSSVQWSVDGVCADTLPPVESVVSMVSRGHLAGAVITALLCGILFGACCMKYGPKVFTHIHEEILPHREQKKEEPAQAEEEMSTFVQNQISNKPPVTGRPRVGIPVPVSEIELPGDSQHPKLKTTRKALNNYTPYKLLKKVKADKNQKTFDVTKPDDAKKGCPSSRAMAPLPELPVDAKVKVADKTSAAEPEEVYVNANVSVYDGLKAGGSIYENRDIQGDYEVFATSEENKK